MDDPWNVAHERLKEWMHKEISIMREILANMLQEELSIQLNDLGSLDQVMCERSSMVERLSTLRSARLQATKNLEELAASRGQERVPPFDDASNCEILLLSEQIMALTEKMNDQNCRNNLLTHQMKHMPPLMEKTKRSLPHTCVKVINKGYESE